MSKSNGPSEPRTAINELKSAAEDLLRFAAGVDLAESDLFPYGVNRISLQIKAGDAELNLEISGPDHAHGHDDPDEWALDEEDVLDDGE